MGSSVKYAAANYNGTVEVTYIVVLRASEMSTPAKRIVTTLFCGPLVATLLMQPSSAQESADSAEARSPRDNAPEMLPEPNTSDAEQLPPSRRYPTLGVTIESAAAGGAKITGIVSGSPADRVGLPLGGVIVAFDGERIGNLEDLVTAVRSARTNRPIELSYYDGERRFRKRVELLAPDPYHMPPSLKMPERQLPIVGVPAATQMAALRELIVELQQQMKELQAKVADLESKLSE